MPDALVTGASRGMGLEFTRQLLERGYTVFAAARAPARSEGLAKLEEAHTTLLHFVPLDVADADAIAGLPQTLAPYTRRLDLLVNNAGINSKGVPESQRNLTLGQLEPEGILQMVRVNAIGPVLVTQALLPLLEAADAARVLHVSSWLGSIGDKTRGNNYGYNGSKAALNMLGRLLGLQLKERGIVSALLNPGWVKTDMGGDKAERTAEQAVQEMLTTMLSLSVEQAAGFYDADGTPHAW